MFRSLSLPLALLVVLCPAGQIFAADAAPAMQLTGAGDQVYVCTVKGDQFAWTLKAPEATLTEDGKVVGKHFAGPTWQAEDGSSVVGEVIATSPSPRPDAIPWLVLHAKSHTGSGLMADVAYVVRTNTEGGLAPNTGCDAAHTADEKRVHYSATYLFFRGPVAQ